MAKRGLITLEFCILIILVVAGSLAMHGYLKRAIQGNWKGNADSFSDDYYEPGVSRGYVSPITYVQSNIETKHNDAAGRTIENHFDVALPVEGSSAKILQIPSWGSYGNPAEYESDEDEE